MLAVEAPRLSGFLRTFFTSGGKEFDLQKQQLRQIELLKSRRNVGKKLENASLSAQGLVWSYFADAAKGEDERKLRDMRRVYNEYLKQVMKLIGDETASEELHSAAQFIFETLKEDSPEGQKREKLTASLGIVPAKLYQELSASVKTLSDWRNTFAKEDPKSSEKLKSNTSQSKEGEWGETIEVPISKFGILESSFVVQDKYQSDDDEGGEEEEEEEQLEGNDDNKSITNKQQQQQQQQQYNDRDEYNYWREAELMQVHPNWLNEQCDIFIASSGLDMSPQELSSTIYLILKSQISDSELQGKLFDLLGDKSFDFIQLLLKKRIEILTLATIGATKVTTVNRPGPSIVIATEEEKYLEKLSKKQGKRKGGKSGIMDMNVGMMSQDDYSSILNAKELRKERENALSVANDIGQLAPAGTLSDTSGTYGQNMMLPEGTERKQTKTYEEVRVPYPKQKPFSTNERLIPISEFDEFAQPAFKGFKSLNRIQSRLFETAYKTNENLLVCAPTGAGKTNVALMTILHEIGQNIINGKIHKESFKIVYVAPMKALASEMTDNFSKRLSPLGITCKELTGDMQLSKKELTETQIIVTTPEKWDVITRKSGDMALTSLVRLLIIDEVHLLHEDRGPVIEVLISRTLRQVESSQSMIRIVGLSATLPNYRDVAAFLKVGPNGLFFFDNSYRPVPLEQIFIGVKENNPLKQKGMMNDICYDKVIDSINKGNQVMVFVHSRKDTAKTGEILVEIARSKDTLEKLMPDKSDIHLVKREVERSRNRELKNLFQYGIGIHHAGMLRSDRNLVERLFSQGYLKVLCCTATLAWGVNLPAHTVIIKGTQLYDSKQGAFVELGMLDVMQIFGRAGRPQFDTSGEGIIITSHDKLSRYLALLNQQLPIESQFISSLSDHLNAEIVLGTVSNVREAVTWLSYTYLYIRMLKNPLAYGLTYSDKELDTNFEKHRRGLIINAARNLDNCKMIRYHEESGNFAATELGRVASHYYIKHETVSLFNERLQSAMGEPDILDLISQSSEFSNITLKEEEMSELDTLKEDACAFEVKGGVENKQGKVNVLIQSYLSHATIDAFALVSDSAYIIQNTSRILRGLFDIVIKKGWVSFAERLLNLGKMIEKRLWDFQHPLRQFQNISPDILNKLELKRADMDKLIDMEPSEIGSLIGHPKAGSIIKKAVNQFPKLEIDVQIQPITRTVLRVQLTITPSFEWNDRIHGQVEPWWIWIEDAENEHIYHYEYFLLYKKQKDEQIKINFTIPIFEPLPPQYYVHAISDRWIGAESITEMTFKHLILPHQHPPHTELLDLQPLPVNSLNNKDWESLYPFTHFNPIQTQVFHTLFHTNQNVLLGAPTGSGKTITAELAIFKLFRDNPGSKVVYIGPLKALVRERLLDWQEKFGKKLGKRVIELTGDYTPNIRALQTADIVTTTPEKWDGISRNWQQRGYVKAVGLIIIDEIHLLGEERGPILEVIVSRMRYISSQTDKPVRIVGLSTALANARDLADWLGIDKVGLFNFRPSVRPVPIEAYIQGYPGKHYCPRMATMNKPCYSAIQTHSLDKPVLIFVSSRRQTRLTALDLITYCAADDSPRKFLRMSENELDRIISKIKDTHLKHTLSFGIALHHAGLTEDDKKIVENLFANNMIQILISTSTLAWGVNLPAHLVIIKGTEFFDPKTRQYVDYPITDVLQMMGRAGRPQFDTSGKAVIMVHDPKKNFYKKFLYEPFPVESSLQKVLHDHFNAEVVSGTIKSKQDAIDYLTWTFFFRRLLMNPTYYGLEDTSLESMNKYLSSLVDNTIDDLERSKCLSIIDDFKLEPLTYGRVASYYYLHYSTMRLFNDKLRHDNDIKSLLDVLTKTSEYGELPVRHNEDKLNSQLASDVPWPVDTRTLESPHTKAHLLLQAHFSHLPLPISDYITDTKSVLDQAVRILQAMVDISADGGWLFTTLNTMQLQQMVMQGRWIDDSPLLTLPHFKQQHVDELELNGIESLPQLLVLGKGRVQELLTKGIKSFSSNQIRDITRAIEIMPLINIKYDINDDNGHKSSKFISGSDAFIKIELNRESKMPIDGVHAPYFPKRKDEGWWIVIGDPKAGELIALRRLTLLGKSTKTTLTFDVPDVKGSYTYCLYFMCDSYIGLDQQYEIKFDVV